MRMTALCADAEIGLQELFFGQAIVLRGNHDHGDGPRLIHAGVILNENNEIWFELSARHHADDGQASVDFTLRIVAEESLPQPLDAQLRIADNDFVARLGPDLTASWRVPAHKVLDPKTKRVLKPIAITITDG